MSTTVLKGSILRLLIYITFCFSDLVSSECPTPGPDSVVKYKGSNINISDVVACASWNRGKSLIVIQSFNSTIFDVDYPNFKNLSTAIQPSLLIITPIGVHDQKRQVHLTGVAGKPAEAKPSGQGRRIGKPGNPGGTAGGCFLIYGAFTSKSTPYIARGGGEGGNGQDGQDGRDGRNGTAKEIIEHDEEHCSAWEDGWTRVWLEPHQCYEQTDNDGGCFAGSTGARWEIFGEDGERGEDGNDGGAPGIGGNHGNFLIADIGARKNVSIGGGGVAANGTAGNAGKPGKGGKVGDSIIVTVGVEEAPDGKKCGFLRGPIRQPVEQFAMNGNPGNNGINTVGQRQSVEPFALEDIRPHIESYLIECAYEATEQGNAELMKFCDDVRTHFSL